MQETREKAKKHIEELMKNKHICRRAVKSNERKIIEEIERRAIDLSVEKVRVNCLKASQRMIMKDILLPQ